MKIKDLGGLEGPVMLFGGVYSNLRALEALLAEAGRRGISPASMICTGDIAGYCAEPSESLALIRETGLPVVAGNVERQLAAGAGDCGCGFAPGSTCAALSDAWYDYADGAFDAEARGYMADLPDAAVFAHEGRRYAVIHGGVSDISRFLWPSSPDEAFRSEISAVTGAFGPVDGVIAGHSGVAFERVIDGVHWINAGVIGLPPHDGRADTRFVILSADGARIERLYYDHEGAAAAMRAAGLTQGYDATVSTGIWPSEDILPKELRR